MRLLTRKEVQAVHIGNDITVTVYKDNHGQVRPGIDAPSGLKILRDELVKPEFECPAMVRAFDYSY